MTLSDRIRGRAGHGGRHRPRLRGIAARDRLRQAGRSGRRHRPGPDARWTPSDGASRTSATSPRRTARPCSDVLSATTDYAALAECDAIFICVPTPFDSYKTPDLSFVIAATESIAPHLRAGHLVVLQSTTYPGTTEEVVQPILERRRPARGSGLPSGLLARADRPRQRQLDARRTCPRSSAA